MCSRASDYGLMKIDDKGRVLYFNEKPKGEELKTMVRVNLPARPASLIGAQGCR